MKSDVEIALQMAARDIVRMQSSALGLPVDATRADTIYKEYIREAQRSRNSKESIEKIHQLNGRRKNNEIA
jgi:hypothetical protein